MTCTQPVNHCFTTCTSRTSHVKPFTGRICSTILDKDASLACVNESKICMLGGDNNNNNNNNNNSNN